jgi:hypothetical protein
MQAGNPDHGVGLNGDSTEMEDSVFHQALLDPERSGVDLENDLVYFRRANGAGMYGVLEGKLKDSAHFRDFTQMMLRGATLKSADGINSGRLGEAIIVAWSKNRFVFLHNIEKPQEGNTKPNKINSDSLDLLARQTLTLDDSKTLGTDKRFASLFNDGGDIHAWINSSLVYENLQGDMAAYLSMLKIDALTNENYMAVSLSFDAGKISIHSKHYYNKEMSDLIKRNPPQDLDANEINRIPANAVAGFAWNYNPTGLKDLMQLTGLDGLATVYFSRANISVEEMVNAGKGKLIFAMADAGMQTAADSFLSHGKLPDSTRRHHVAGHFIVAFQVDNKNSFQKLLNWGLSKSGTTTQGLPGFTYKMQDDWFAAGNDSLSIAAALAGTGTANPYLEKIKGYPAGGYVDFRKFFDGIHPSPADTGRLNKLNIERATWEDAVITGGNYKDGAVVYTIEINMKDKKQNSLKQMNVFAGEIINNSIHFPFMHHHDYTVTDTLPTNRHGK